MAAGGGSARQQCLTGKYGALVLYRATSAPGRTEPVEEMGRRLCQHVVGMSPASIGSVEEEQRARESSAAAADQQVTNDWVVLISVHNLQ